MKKPNIIFVISDQHRSCDLGCYGNKDIMTPNFDEFSKKAIRFSNCISNCPVCVPMRGSILTGLMPLRHGAVTNDLAINKNTESMADVLNANGYHAGYIGKWHLGGIPRDRYIPEGERLGFAQWKANNCCHSYMNSYYYDKNNHYHRIDGYEPIAQTDMAIDFISENSDRAWGLVLAYGTPHDPYFEMPVQYLEKYNAKNLTLRKNVSEKIKETTEGTITKEEIQKAYQGYYSHISALDEQFGRLLDALKASGQFDNTIIVYTSDHGDMLGSQGLTYKQLPYDESIKVPLMVYWNGKTISGVSEELIGLVDLPVSLMGLMGLEFKNKTDGMDLSGLFTDKTAKGLDYAYIFDLIPCHQAYDRGDTDWRGLRSKTHTIALATDRSVELLFDNQNDPYQQDNIFDSYDGKDELLENLYEFVNRHDKFCDWKTIINEYGLKDEWNSSQSYFQRELL